MANWQITTVLQRLPLEFVDQFAEHLSVVKVHIVKIDFPKLGSPHSPPKLTDDLQNPYIPLVSFYFCLFVVVVFAISASIAAAATFTYILAE